MVSVLPVSASACFILRAVFGVLFIMASAFFRMLGHNRFPSVFQLERLRSSIACSRGTDFHQEAFYVYVKAR